MTASYTNTVCARKRDYSAAVVCRPSAFGDKANMGKSNMIAALRKRRGWTQEQLAGKLGVEQPTVQRWEKGTRDPDMSTLVDIAAALGVEPGDLFGQDALLPIGPKLFIKGEVAAGVWLEATEWAEDDWQSFTGRPDVTAELSTRFGLRVDGESMNLLYPPGSIVECVSVFGHTEIAPGKRVVIVREREDHRFEATVKELVQDAHGKMWAVPRSSDPSFLPISLNDPEPGIIETRIAAVVVASYRPE